MVDNKSPDGVPGLSSSLSQTFYTWNDTCWEAAPVEGEKLLKGLKEHEDGVLESLEDSGDEELKHDYS